MNQIRKKPVTSLGYDFIPPQYLPPGKDEYYLRNSQNENGISYRQLTAFEIEVLVRNRNTSDNWNNILVSDAFSPERVHNCKFFGLVRIGKLEPYFIEFKNLRRPVGLYNSTIISCDFGDNVVVDNVNYISHYVVCNEVIIVNVNELATTDYARFGNGAVKDGEDEKLRIWLELCNENGGRKVIPFDGMLPGDAFLWTQSRDDEPLQARFREFTLKRFDTRRGYYGTIGDRTVIKNCKIIKDVNIGSDAYLKGANKLKNLTINSSADAMSQIGEGCELVNGIIDYGCRIFYGVKAVRFFMASHSQLKYGARLINSYLGNNSTISCCEVLNSLIFPFHEQHHNNSFLCAAVLQGQTNIAAGVTIGSNHNSRSPDGEMIAGRGFWPGLCVSLKHNSRFASFTMLSKGDYPAELNIPLPFSLISNDVTNDMLVVMPGYWFLYNMYALARNAWKYGDRDKRTEKKQLLEHQFLAPDTINEIVDALALLETFTANALAAENPAATTSDARALLQADDPSIDRLTVYATGFENSRRKTLIVKVRQAYQVFREVISYYAASCLVDFLEDLSDDPLHQLSLLQPIPTAIPQWRNIGGQLIRAEVMTQFRHDVLDGSIGSWDDVHSLYAREAKNYRIDRLQHALAAEQSVNGLTMDPAGLRQLLTSSVRTRRWMVEGIYNSRAKDYSNPFRLMMYENRKELEKVTGSLADNPFILQEREALAVYEAQVAALLERFTATPAMSKN